MSGASKAIYELVTGIFSTKADDIIDPRPVSLVSQLDEIKGKTFKDPAYQNLPSSSISIKSKKGRKLRKMTKEAGLNNTPVNNVYIGWQKDYNKGVKKRK